MRLFGSSGVRGLANEELTTILAERVGSAVATGREQKMAALYGADALQEVFDPIGTHDLPSPPSAGSTHQMQPGPPKAGRQKPV